MTTPTFDGRAEPYGEMVGRGRAEGYSSRNALMGSIAAA